MFQTMRTYLKMTLAILLAGIAYLSVAQTPAPVIGIVIMHGKGGLPSGYVSTLAATLAEKGYLVANLNMPWSKSRDYDVNVNAAENETVAAISMLRSKGAKKVFVAGHSQGGIFALYFGGRHAVDGVIAIAPGGDVSSTFYRNKVSASVDMARELVAGGKGDNKAKLNDYEGRKGLTEIITTPVIYLSWFDPDGAMNQTLAMKNMNPRTPVLYIGPTGDIPALRRAKQPMFDALPEHPLSKLYEPDSNHIDAPTASRDEIVRWTTEVGNQAGPTR